MINDSIKNASKTKHNTLYFMIFFPKQITMELTFSFKYQKFKGLTGTYFRQQPPIPIIIFISHYTSKF